jgi:hypothetical protein
MKKWLKWKALLRWNTQLYQRLIVSLTDMILSEFPLYSMSLSKNTVSPPASIPVAERQATRITHFETFMFTLVLAHSVYASVLGTDLGLMGTR